MHCSPPTLPALHIEKLQTKFFDKSMLNSTVAGDYDTYCQNACIGSLSTKIDALATCGGNFQFGLNISLKFVLSAIKLPCRKINNIYCYSTVATLLLAGAPTPSMLDTACSGGCVNATVQDLYAFGTPALVEALKPITSICMKDRDKFCAIENMQLGATKPQFSDPDPDVVVAFIQQQSDWTKRACNSTCGRRKIVIDENLKLVVANETTRAGIRGSRPDGIVMADYACLKNINGTLCESLGLLPTLLFDLNTKCDTFPTSCSATCKTWASSLMTTMGCCVRHFIATNPILYFATSGNPGAIENFVGVTCELTFPPPCSGVNTKNRLSGSLILNNLAWSYVSSNNRAAAVQQDIVADLSAATGIVDSKISVSISQKGSGVACTYTISCADDAELNLIKSDITSQFSSNSFVMATVSSYSEDSKVDASLPMTLESSSVTVVDPTSVSSSTGSSSSSSTGSTSTTTSTGYSVAPVMSSIFFVVASLFLKL